MEGDKESSPVSWNYRGLPESDTVDRNLLVWLYYD